MARRVDLTLAEVQALCLDVFVRIALPTPVWLPDGNLATSVLIGRVQGEIHAYANVCRHHPVPLDSGELPVLAPDGVHLLCQSHGALYRATDGACIAGPCVGQALFRAKVVVRAGRISVEL
jgi:nitrite reductase/ring-hydroxylating ferredoxin subunit